jgi:hypothetical protein
LILLFVSFGVDGVGGVEGFVRPHERLLPALFREKVDDDFGTGGIGMLVNGLSCGDRKSSPLDGRSVEDGAVDAALSREELSVVDAVFEFDPPLALEKVSDRTDLATPS